MHLTIACTDTAGATTTTSVTFLYDARYDTDSSLAEIAGDYTVNSATNTLNINGDDTLFGMYHNGPCCTPHGLGHQRRLQSVSLRGAVLELRDLGAAIRRRDDDRSRDAHADEGGARGHLGHCRG
jgi:hypothetical protein